jgi:uncharacterized protein YgiM (DUF1202 family)
MARKMDIYYESKPPYRWRSNIFEMREKLYEYLMSDNYKSLPIGLQKLREEWDFLLSTIKINGIGINDKEIGVNYTTNANLRLRESAIVTAQPIATLRKGTIVKVIEKGKVQTINGITAPWVKITTSDGYTGWCFSGYLE